MEIYGQDAELPEIRHRMRLFGRLAVLVCVLLAARLFHMQVIEGDTYYRLTSESVVRTTILPAVRGQIRDRKGRPLAATRASYDVFIAPQQISPDSYQRLRATLGADAAWRMPGWAAIEAARRDRGQALLAAEDIARETMAALETELDNAGIRVVAVPRRHYPQGALAAHALGFLNEVSAEEVRTRKDEGYQAGDVIGRTGLERQWEPYLRGQKGFEKAVVDRRALRARDLRVEDVIKGPARRDPVPGNHLVLTLDVDVQRIVERALRDTRASAAVVLEVGTGRILALASRPAFDPNVMSGHLTPEVESRMMSDRLRPFRDKVLSETYNPGSTFKAVTALAGLEEQVVSPDDRVRCAGSLQVARRRFKCAKVHGVVSLHDALVQSCNVYFYELGARPGMMARIAKFAMESGLGAPAGLGLNGEQPGFVPTEDWHRAQAAKDSKEGFVIGHALNTSIGEGATRLTVLQMALLYAAIANGGRLWLPQIVERVESPAGQVIEEFAPRARRDIAVSAESLALLRRALHGVVNEPKGTAYKARSLDIDIAGKTGTAQSQHGGRKQGDDTIVPYERLDHAWFAGFAPAAAPRIAFAILVEHGGHGGDVAAPVATEIVEGYFGSVAAPEERGAQRLSRRGRPRVTRGAR